MATEVNDRFYQGRTVLTEAQMEELERLLSYHDAHADAIDINAGEHGAPRWFYVDSVAFLRDLLPESSPWKTEA